MGAHWRRYGSVVAVLFSMLTWIGHIQAGRILVVPLAVKSHMSYTAQIAEALTQEGHELYAVYNPLCAGHEILAKAGIKLIMLNDTQNCKVGSPDHVKFHQQASFWTKIATLRAQSDNMLMEGRSVLGNKELFNTLRQMKFDLALVDGIALGFWHYIVPYKLDLPVITFTTGYHPWIVGIPSIPSFVPSLLSPYTEQMSFLERLGNLLSYASILVVFPSFSGSNDQLVIEYAPEKPFIPVMTLVKKTSFWLINEDCLLGYPNPTMPHVAQVGGLTTKPAKPLNSDLKSLLDSATEGAIVMSFGSIATSFPPAITDKFVEAFRQIPFPVIWRLVDPPKDLPKNIHALQWLPQADILAHPNTRLFITHSGNNGQFEALYHGVPMLSFPIFGDQFYNARRAEYNGYGIQMDIYSFRADELVKNINYMVSTTKHRDQIKRASEIFKSRPEKPKERARFWVNHILKFGGSHLRSHGLDMPLYQYWMLDILIFLLSVTILTVYLIILICKFFARKICRGDREHKKKD